MAGISNVRIGGKRARKVKGKWTTKKKEKKKKKVVAKQVLPKKAPVVQPVIKLKPKEKEKTLAGKAIELARGKGKLAEEIKEKTLAGTLPIGPGGAVGIGKEVVKGIGMAFGKGAKAASKTIKLTRPLRKIGQQINVNQIGKSAGLTTKQTAALSKQIGRERINVLARYAVNPKSTSLTKSIIKGVGGSAALVGVIGSYPFAGFIKEESLQILGFATRTAQNMGDVEGMETAIKEQEEILNPDAMDKLISVIPYANVVKQLKDFYKAASTKLEQDKRFLEQKRTEEPEEDKWAKIYADQEARREAQRADDEEYYAGIQDSLASAREEGRAEDERYYAEINEENRKRKEAADAEELEEMHWKAEYYDLIRQGKYEEAQALLESKLKGGE